MTKKKKQKKKRNIPGIFSLVAFLFFLFFIIPFAIHRWASSLPLQLHFCNHFACVIYSLIWLALAIVGWTYLDKKKNKKTENKKTKRKTRKAFIIIAVVVLVVGIILMNITYCSADGSIHFSDFSNWFTGLFTFVSTVDDEGCKPGVDCPVPIPPCVDTDDGHDYISYGEIRSGLDIGDKCMGDDILRERFCSSTLTYSSEDINCNDTVGDGYYCLDGECVLGALPPEDDEEEDEDGDDEEIGDDCTHDSVYPFCLGSCDFEPTKTYPAETICAPVPTSEDGTTGMCICMSEFDTPCGIVSDGITCAGYCAYDMFCIHQLDSNNCYCDSSPCYETDSGYDIFIPGTCIDPFGIGRNDFCNGDVLEEYQCTPAGCSTFPTDCEALIGNYKCLEDADDVGYCGELPE